MSKKLVLASGAAGPGLDDAEFDGFVRRIQARFVGALAANGNALFTTDAGEDNSLFDAYLDALPDHRQYHTCHCCRRFIVDYGSLVVIDERGVPSPAVWDADDAPDFYRAAVEAISSMVRRSRVTGVFKSKLTTYGYPQTGEWNHFALIPPRELVFQERLHTAGQVAAEKLEDYRNIQRALADFTLPMLNEAMRVLEADALYRADRVIGPARWLRDLHVAREGLRGTAKDNVTWRAIALAPAGFCHPRSSMIGTLLEDIAAGHDFGTVSRRFASKMNPQQYQRAQAAPSAGSIVEAEKIVAKLGIAPSLERRYARLDEVQAIWKSVGAPKAQDGAGVFSHLKAKGAPEVAGLNLPSKAITWEKFRRDILPSAHAIEAYVSPSTDRFAALVTAANGDAPPILQWDADDCRNPVSWYYASGIDVEIKKRVLAAGGQYTDVDIRASLIWNNRNDLDLHVLTPGGEHVFYASKHSRCGGSLDVDRNVRGETTEPIENTRWPKGVARSGRYQVWVENYRHHDSAAIATPFAVELEINGEVFAFAGIAPPYANHVRMPVAVIDYVQGVRPEAINGLRRASAGAANEWGVAPGWVKATAIVESPNLWGKTPIPHFGQHAFVLLEGCKDTTQGVGRGFFTEALKSDLRQVRSVLEAYTASAKIAGAESATACGLGISKQSTGDMLVRVTSASGGSAAYKIDRWD
jgi:hypothetical protein